MWTTDRLLGGIAVGIGLMAGMGCLAIDAPPATTQLSPRFFPLLLSSLLAVFGLALMLRNAGRPLSAVKAVVCHAKSFLLVLALLVYTATFGLIDYRLATFLFLAANLALLRATRRELLIFPLAATCCIYLLFRYGFSVLLPIWW